MASQSSVTGQQSILQSRSAAQAAADQGAYGTVVSDLNSDNYAGAFQAALGSDIAAPDGSQANGQMNPLVQDLLTSGGLTALDPTKQWTDSDYSSYYSALTSDSVYGKVGANPYGLWGNAASAAKDAQANYSSSGANGSAPNAEQFAGATPAKGFLSNYGPAIIAVGDAVATAGVGAEIAAAQYGVDVAELPTLVSVGANAAQGAAIGAMQSAGNGGSALTGALTGGISGGLQGGTLQNGISGAVNDATGIGSTLSSGLVGAGVGALKGAVTGGNVGLSALAGGVGGAVQGSGIAGNIASATGLPTGLVNGATNYAASGLTGLAAGALVGSGNSGGAQVSGSALSQGTQNAQGNISNMAGGISTAGGGYTTNTDQSLAGTITGALPGVLSTAASVYGSQNAAEAVTNADTNAINTQTSTLGNINNIWATQQGLGQGADTALGSALGTNGQPANYSGFENMPGYQFAVQQGTQAIQRQAASMGSAYTPNTAAAVGQYVTGTAMSDYNTYISQLMGAAGLGTTANQGIATPTYQTGANISTLQQNQGYAQASGVQGSANTIAGALGASGVGGSLIGAAGKALGNGSSSTGASAGTPSAGTAGYNPDGSTDANSYASYNTQSGVDASSQNFLGDTSTIPATTYDPSYTPIDTSSLVDDSNGSDLTSFLGGL